MFQYSICAFLAPALVSAAAFPWPGPEPTFIIPEADNWSPAPTAAPNVGHGALFKRAGENTCGFVVLGGTTRSLTCNKPGYICATNAVFAAHGCCDSSSISTCVLPTQCIPMSSISASCNDSCMSNNMIAKCTLSTAAECYEWRYVYGTTTTMTEHGCGASAFTLSVQRSLTASDITYSDLPSSITIDTNPFPATSTKTASTSTSHPTPTLLPAHPSEKSKPPIGAIIGGSVGGFAVLSALLFGLLFLYLRSKKEKRRYAAAARNSASTQPFMGPTSGLTEYKPHSQSEYGRDTQGTAFFEQARMDALKAWPDRGQRGSGGTAYTGTTAAMSPPLSPPMYPGCVGGPVAEAGGRELRVYEAP
ncbi:hypothetical protein B0J11DRAFT_174598 [Dendryphion nanum]|uniref:Uncharacterized protein n=1 Tax=Dendryphion nanum TaxID=256645 RepID=A0A9P9EF03_9PLEO|nr:hypothetical protein B0J11DRAFT_174598 [Dendryphion nanum]